MTKNLKDYLEELYGVVTPEDIRLSFIKYKKSALEFEKEDYEMYKGSKYNRFANNSTKLKHLFSIFKNTSQKIIKDIYIQNNEMYVDLENLEKDLPQLNSLTLEECLEISVDEKYTTLFLKELALCLDVIEQFSYNKMAIQEEMARFGYILDKLREITTKQNIGKLFISLFREDMEKIASQANELCLKFENFMLLKVKVEGLKLNDRKNRSKEIRKFYLEDIPYLKQVLYSINKTMKDVIIPELDSIPTEDVYNIKPFKKAKILLKYSSEICAEELKCFTDNYKYANGSLEKIENHIDFDEWDRVEEIDLSPLEAVAKKNFTTIERDFKELFAEKHYDNSDYFSERNNQDDTNWSNYNDALDSDQQGMDFWNQF